MALTPSIRASPLRAYGLALVMTLVAFWPTSVMPFLQARPYATSLAAVILSAWLAGFRPALLSILLSVLVINIHRAATFPEGWDAVVQLTQSAIYVAVATLIAWFARARELSEREARRQGARLEAMFGQASIGIALVSLDGRLMRVNRRMAQIIGRSVEESEEITHEQITHPDDWSANEGRIKAIAAGTAQEFATDQRFLRPDGSSVWVHLSVAPLLDADARPDGLIATVEDVSERHEAENRLRVSENRYRSLVDASTAIVCTTDAGGGFATPQESWRASTGQDEAQYHGWGWSDAVHPDDRERVKALWRDALANRWPVHTETRLWNAATGAYRWYSARAVPRLGPDGAVEEWVGALTDIDERRRAEIRLRESEERARLALEIGQLGTMTWLPEKNQVWADPRCREICGLAGRGAIDPADLYQRIHPEDREHAERTLAHAARHSHPYAEEFRFVHADGSVRWVIARGKVVLRSGASAAPAPVLFGSIMDVTERRLAEEALREADREKDNFLALLAHELRNPLAPIRTAVQLLKMRRQPDDEGQRLHALIDRQVQHLVRMVDDLLDVSRVLRGKVELRREAIEIADAVAIAAETSRPLIDLQRQHLIVQQPDHSVTVHGDQVRLAQVIANLLNNASKYSDPGGTIRLSVSNPGEDVIIEVADEGAGISPEMLPRIFEPFVQADRSLERSRGGLGIGLTLVKKLVELHQGQVSAMSGGLGQGSTFSVRLAAHSEAAAAVHPAAPGASIDGVHSRILVVDDNVDAAESLALLLGKAGHTVSVAHNGRDAVDRADVWRPDIVLLDIGLPIMNGYEAARVLRQRGDACPDLIAVTGYGQASDAQRAFEAGFQYHLVKPVDAGELMGAIARCVAARNVGSKS